MMENDTQNSQQAASTALHNAPKLAKIAQAGVQGGPAGAATEAAVQYCKEILVVAIAVLLLPVLVLLMLPGAIFGTLTQPSTAVNDDLEVATNVMQLRNAVSDILQVAYEDTLAEIESERASLTYSDIDDSVGGHVSYNAFQLISMYSAYQGEDDYTKISLADLSAQVQAHRTEYYTYTTSEEVRTEPVQKEVRGQTITVQEDHTYTVFTLSYVGDDYFADTVWQLDDKQKSCADAYAHNLTVYLHEIEEHEGITILGQINDRLPSFLYSEHLVYFILGVRNRIILRFLQLLCQPGERLCLDDLRVVLCYGKGKAASVQRLLEKHVDGIGQGKTVLCIHRFQFLLNFRVDANAEHIRFSCRNNVFHKKTPFVPWFSSYPYYTFTAFDCQSM